MRIRKQLEKSDLYLCELLKATGLRVDDLLCSKSWNWTINPNHLEIIEKKTGKVRKIVKDGWLLCLARSYREERGLPWGSHWEGYFCPSAKKIGAHINRSTLLRHFEIAIKRAGLEGLGYTIHSLRKCYAIDLYERLGSISAVQKELNHDRFETTLIYLMDALDISL